MRLSMQASLVHQMNPTQTQQLPHRLKESTFRVFETDIGMIVTAFPKVVELKPKGEKFTSLTYTARLRDAMTSLALFKWATQQVDMSKFEQVRGMIVVSHRSDGRIFAGSREELKLAANRTSETTVQPFYCEANFQTLPLVSQETKELVCTLASLKLLSAPVRVSGLTAADKEKLEDSFDVAVCDNGDGTWTIV